MMFSIFALNNNTMVHIYGLADPITKDIRYIGKSIRVKGRYNDHLNDKSKTYKANWITSLRKRGLKPFLIILEELNDTDDWQKVEIEWIKKAKKSGWKLVNATDGGDGVTNISGEGYERMRTTWIGRKHTPETLIKLSKASKGRRKTKEQKEAMSKIMKGREIKWKDKLKVAVRKFTPKKVKEIKQELKTIKGSELAKKYNVHRTTITKIKLDKYF